MGWFLVVTFSFLVLGAVGVAGVGIYVAKTASAYIADFREDPVEAFVDLADAVDEEVEVVSRSDDDKTVTLRIRDTDDVVTVDLSDLPKMLGGNGLQSRAEEQLADGVEFDGEADETGGVLTVRTSEGETRIELRGDDGGGFLKITTPDDEFHLGAGGEARSLPGWVPVYPGAKVEKRLFSADTEEGRVGAALLSVDGDPEEVLEWYEDTMPGEGFVASTTRMQTDDGEFRGKIEWTNHRGDDEREVSVAVGWDDDEDGFLFLFYRDER
ncbi:MAG: hypothetical protein ACR2QM_00440 [Longimicrobiales bacterium]